MLIAPTLPGLLGENGHLSARLLATRPSPTRQRMMAALREQRSLAQRGKEKGR
jgi:hypothetical protein